MYICPRYLGGLQFSGIERNQVDATALNLLRYLVAQGEGGTVDETAIARQLLAGWQGAVELLSQRELIELTPTGYRFQVELIRCWFACRSC